MPLRTTLCLPLLCLVCAGAAAQLVSDPAYVEGRAAWQQRHWVEAVTRLRPLVDPRDRANHEVDYWLGTSLCRTAGRVAQGANILDWSLSFRNMPETARPAFDFEKKACLRALNAAGVPASVPDDPGGTMVAMATVRGTPKLFIQGGTAGNLALAPLRVVAPRPVAELEGRLVARGDSDTMARKLRALAPGARLHISRHAAIASASPPLSESDLRTLGRRVDDFIDFLGAAYGLEPPPTYITVHLVPSVASLKGAAMHLHGMRANDATLGYSFANDRSIVAMLTTTAAGTLLHEVSHMLVHESFGAVPQWLDEGIASLYETATAIGGAYFGEPNWRSPVFAQLRQRLPRLSLREVVTAPWFSDEPQIHRRLQEPDYDPEQQAYLLAYARMFALYLQETGALRTVFKAFRDRGVPEEYSPAHERAVRLLEQALQRPLGAIESDFLAWAPKAYDRDTRFYANRARAEAIRKELPERERIERQLPDGNIEREAPP